VQNFEGFDDLLNNESFDGTDDMDPLIDAVRYAQSLPEREQMVLRMYIDGYTQAEIGAELGYSQRRIGQILQNISKKGAESA